MDIRSARFGDNFGQLNRICEVIVECTVYILLLYFPLSPFPPNLFLLLFFQYV